MDSHSGAISDRHQSSLFGPHPSARWSGLRCGASDSSHSSTAEATGGAPSTQAIPVIGAGARYSTCSHTRSPHGVQLSSFAERAVGGIEFRHRLASSGMQRRPLRFGDARGGALAERRGHVFHRLLLLLGRLVREHVKLAQPSAARHQMPAAPAWA